MAAAPPPRPLPRGAPLPPPALSLARDARAVPLPAPREPAPRPAPAVSPWTKQPLGRPPAGNEGFSARVGAALEEAAPRGTEAWGARAAPEAISLASVLASARRETPRPAPAGKKGKAAQWRPLDLAALAQPRGFAASSSASSSANSANASNSSNSATFSTSSNAGTAESGGRRVVSFKEIQRQQEEERERRKEKAGAQGGWGAVLRQNVVPASLIAREPKEEAKQRHPAKPTQSAKQTKQASEGKEETPKESFMDVAKQKAGKLEARRMEGEGGSDAFEEWCKDQMVKLYGSDDISLLEFCRDLDDDQILPYLQDLLGTSKRVTEFGKEFIRRKHM